MTKNYRVCASFENENKNLRQIITLSGVYDTESAAVRRIEELLATPEMENDVYFVIPQFTKS